MLSKDKINEILSIEENRKYLELLSTKYPNISAAATEIINLEAILNLPKATEHFMADLHGEDEAFQHVLRNASGVIKSKINENFKHLSDQQIVELATLIYYPVDKLKILHSTNLCSNKWYRDTLKHLIKLTGILSSKYTRSKTRKTVSPDFRYIVEELLHESVVDNPHRKDYYTAIINTMISINRADDFIVALCRVIQRLTIDRLHIVGDIYDRGPGAHRIIELLKDYGNYDIQWGNHDILWMGAACGNLACIANVVRISSRYANFETLEDGYGINLLPLARFAMETYHDDPCKQFMPKCDKSAYPEKDADLISQMHKAITIIQFKVEHLLRDKNPDYECSYRDLLHQIDYQKGEITIDGKTYELSDRNFPTIDPQDPYRLTPEEKNIITRLRESFLNSEKLQNHIKELYDKGSLYLLYNSNLLFHASVPLDEDGELQSVKIDGEWCKGKRLYDKIDFLAREAFFGKEGSEQKRYACDYMWYLWCGKNSPLFNKSKMATFESYFIADPTAAKEHKGYYHKLSDNQAVCETILKDFGVMDLSTAHIINGHIPVKTKQGESPIKANGKLLVIDGGFAQPFHDKTGISGYTLVFNSYGMQIIQHEQFTSRFEAINHGGDIRSSRFLVEKVDKRLKVSDTDIGQRIITQVKDLKQLLQAFRLGVIDEKL